MGAFLAWKTVSYINGEAVQKYFTITHFQQKFLQLPYFKRCSLGHDLKCACVYTHSYPNKLIVHTTQFTVITHSKRTHTQSLSASVHFTM